MYIKGVRGEREMKEDDGRREQERKDDDGRKMMRDGRGG